MQTWRRSRRHLPPDPFRRGAFIAWGFAKGFTGGRYTLAQAAQKAKQKGYEWVALELDDPTLLHPDDPEHSPTLGEYNLSIYPDFLTAFRLEGLKAGGWTTEGGSVWMVPSDSDLAIAEIEGPGDYDGVVNVIRGVGAGPLPTCPLATVTNFSTITREKAKVLIAAGFSCLPEAYMNESPGMTPDNMDRIARNLGWATSQPVAGVYPAGGNPAPPYPQSTTWPLADYLLEYVI